MDAWAFRIRLPYAHNGVSLARFPCVGRVKKQRRSFSRGANARRLAESSSWLLSGVSGRASSKNPSFSSSSFICILHIVLGARCFVGLIFIRLYIPALHMGLLFTMAISRRLQQNANVASLMALDSVSAPLDQSYMGGMSCN